MDIRILHSYYPIIAMINIPNCL